MERVKLNGPRPEWKQKLEDLSFQFHSLGDTYWDETVAYKFKMDEVLKIEEATKVLWELCLDAVQYVIDNDMYDELRIDPKLVPEIIRSWEEEHISIYGRFDLGFDTNGVPKMLEFNADTPTSLYEAAVVQWYWLQDLFKDKDQFNSIHEKLVAYWESVKGYLEGQTMYFTCVKGSIEDFTTVEYLRDTANQAGVKTAFVYVEDIGFDEQEKMFVDLLNQPIERIFKLYPWEWLVGEHYGEKLEQAPDIQFSEPAWKAILSNKAILPILYRLFPTCPYLLRTYDDEPRGMKDYVKKPIYSREGANITIQAGDFLLEKTEGEYGEEGFIYQQYTKLYQSEGKTAVLGSWIIGGEPAGMGVRESDSLVTGNLSRFVPHFIEG